VPGTNGGTFFTLRVHGGNLRCRSVAITAIGIRTTMRVGNKEFVHTASSNGNSTIFTAKETIVIATGQELLIEARG
jgi:hypothetical protein